MSRIIEAIDPSNAPSGIIASGLVNACGTIVLHNESPYNLILRFADGSEDRLAAWTIDIFEPRIPTPQIMYRYSELLNSADAPSSLVYGVMYEPGERVPGTYPVSLQRQTNIGNALITNEALRIVNLLNPEQTRLVFGQVEGTPQSIQLYNDGSQYAVDINGNVVFAISPADARPVRLGTDTKATWIVSSLYAGGIAFPASPLDGYQFYRLDLHRWYEWNATAGKWLSVQEYPIVATRIDALMPVTTGGNLAFATLDTQERTHVTTIDVSTFVAAPNDATNYWNIGFNFLLATGGNRNIANRSTQGLAAGTHITTRLNVNTVSLATETQLYIAATKTGTPGALYTSYTIKSRNVGV